MNGENDDQEKERHVLSLTIDERGQEGAFTMNVIRGPNMATANDQIIFPSPPFNAPALLSQCRANLARGDVPNVLLENLSLRVIVGQYGRSLFRGSFFWVLQKGHK